MSSHDKENNPIVVSTPSLSRTTIVKLEETPTTDKPRSKYDGDFRTTVSFESTSLDLSEPQRAERTQLIQQVQIPPFI
jgi:hypothetical protein